MPSTIRISEHGHSVLSQLAREAALPMIQVLDVALENYRRQRFLEQANAAYASLRSDAAAADSLREEFASLDTTASDGLDEPGP